MGRLVSDCKGLGYKWVLARLCACHDTVKLMEPYEPFGSECDGSRVVVSKISTPSGWDYGHILCELLENFPDLI
jgi:hypothetical protein